MNPNKKLINLRGKEYPKSFPSQKELDALPKRNVFVGDKEVEVPDRDKIAEKETIGNVILNCMERYIGAKKADKLEGFYINLISQSILSDGKKIEFKEKIKKFLIELLEEMILRRGEETGKDGKKKEVLEGLYSPWVISQVLQELGIDLEK